MFHGLSPQAETTLKEGCADDVEAMEKNARRLKVKLERAGSGAWHLNEADEHRQAQRGTILQSVSFPCWVARSHSVLH